MPRVNESLENDVAVLSFKGPGYVALGQGDMRGHHRPFNIVLYYVIT